MRKQTSSTALGASTTIAACVLGLLTTSYAVLGFAMVRWAASEAMNLARAATVPNF
jgi:hypothetical protein